jgi:hypothetical protein
MILDNLPGGALNSIGMLPTEHNDPIMDVVMARQLFPLDRALRSHCQHHRKRESERDVNGCKIWRRRLHC